KEQPLTMAVPALLIAPPCPAKLSAKLLWVIVMVPWLSMAPPFTALPPITSSGMPNLQFVTVIVPRFSMAPPSPLGYDSADQAKLEKREQLLSVRVPVL